MRYPLVALSLFLLSCGGNDDGGVTAPDTGSLEIRASTSGEPVADYMVTIDGESKGALAPNGTITVSDLEPGFHVVQIVAPPPGCTVAGDNPRTVSVAAGETSVVAFAVNCVPLLGSIQVTTATTGAGPASYDLVMDGVSVGPIGSSTTRTIDNVPPGAHTITLGSIPAECQVQGALPQTVAVEPSATAMVSLSITCTGTPVQTGTLTVITSTTGSDPNGYQVVLDGGPAQPIGLNATLALLSTPAGPHSVLLSDVAPNCSVAGVNPVSTTVTAGANTTVTFTVTCTAPNAPPTARFTHECDGLDCTFTSTSRDDDGTIESWAWDFGDGTTSDDEHPSHTYGSPGTYDVELSVRDDDDATDNVTRQVTVSAAEPAATTTAITEDDPDPSNPSEDITVRFTVSAASGTPAGTVTVTTDLGTESCTDELEDGAGSCILTLTTSGEHTLTATYSGSDAFAESVDQEEHFVRFQTSIVIDSHEPNPSAPGEQVLVEFTVGSDEDRPTGRVRVTANNSDSFCEGDLSDGSGSCSLALQEEDDMIRAEYLGADLFAPSSVSESHAVEAPSGGATSQVSQSF